jgi:hypothetical protein
MNYNLLKRNFSKGMMGNTMPGKKISAGMGFPCGVTKSSSVIADIVGLERN